MHSVRYTNHRVHAGVSFKFEFEPNTACQLMDRILVKHEGVTRSGQTSVLFRNQVGVTRL